MADELAAAHDKIRKAAAKGREADFSTAEDAATPAPYEDDEAWAGRTVDGEWLADFLTSTKSEIHRLGVSVTGVRILGGLNLEAAELRYRLGLLSCQLGDQRFDFSHGKTRLIDLRGTSCNGLWAVEASIADGMRLTRGFVARGQVNLIGVTIDGTLGCDGGTFVTADGIAIDANRARIAGSVYLRDGFDATGEVNFGGGAIIGGSLECDGGQLANPGGDALHASLAGIAGSVFLRHGFSATGGVNIVGATVGGLLDCDRGTFAYADGLALDMSNARVAGSAYFRQATVTVGELNMVGASIGGTLDCQGATFTNPGGNAVFAKGATITGSAVLSGGFAATGEVNLVGVTVGGTLECYDASFTNPDGQALYASRMRIGSSMFLRRCTMDGEVRMVGAVIDGELDAREATLRNPDGRSLRMDGAHVTGALNLSGATSEGEARLRRASVGGFVDLSDGWFSNPSGIAVDAGWIRASGNVRLGGSFTAEGLVSFRSAVVGALRDSVAAWPERIAIDSFHYGRLTGSVEDRSWRARAGWLRRQEMASPDAYVYLAEVYRTVGNEHAARKILIERHNALLRPPEHWKPALPERGWRQVATRAGRWILRATIGHGYEPWRVLWYVVPIVLAMTVWFSHAKQQELLVPTGSTTASSAQCDSSYTCVQPAVYAVDTLVPLVDFGQRTRWSPDQSSHGASWFDDGRWLAAATWLTSALGWVIATLVAASFTQVVRRE